MKLTTLYHIVPVHDGYHYVCLDKYGEHHVVENKTRDNIGDKVYIAFKSEKDAEKYIEKHLDKEKYKSEVFYINLEFFKERYNGKVL